jgi:phosphoribosylformimino-5-aminoimidazole carboxamide ribotide isomerase
MLIIPAIDLMGGRCVRLTKGAFDQSVTYSDEPAEVAASFQNQGARRLHVVDLDGARTGEPVHHEALRAIKAQTDLVVDFGGGIRTRQAIDAALEAGADMLSIGSTAVNNPDLVADWVSEYGGERFIFAADVRGRSVTTSGWKETTAIPVESAIARVLDAGIESALVTDIAVDGTMEGPAIDLYSELRTLFPGLYLIASGGVGSEDDLLALRPTGVDAVIVGKAIYEGKIRLGEFV